MSFGLYILVLVGGGVLVGVLVGLLVRRTSREGVVPPIMLGIVAALVPGIFLTEFARAQEIVGLPVALTVATLYVARSGTSDKPAGHWIGRDGDRSHGFDDCADSGGDGGSCD